MKKVLRLLAVLFFVGALITWLATGVNRGWTKTSVPVKTMDEITGIEGITYEKRFAPGLDFLGAGLLGAVALTGVSFLFRKNSNQNQTQT
jgi:cytochrome bd-type quinol oxidase subunit 2